MIPPHTEFKIKINRIQRQPMESDLCGLYALLFCEQYVDSGGDFKHATEMNEDEILSYPPF